jgi:hypothetical protein
MAPVLLRIAIAEMEVPAAAADIMAAAAAEHIRPVAVEAVTQVLAQLQWYTPRASTPVTVK